MKYWWVLCLFLDPLQIAYPQEAFEGVMPQSSTYILDLELGTQVEVFVLRDASVLNPHNLLSIRDKEGHLYQDSLLQIHHPAGIGLRLNTRLTWCNWDPSMTTGDTARALAGASPWVDLTIPEWELTWSGFDGSLRFGIGAVPWDPGPAKIIKQANIMDWLFAGHAKSMVWGGFQAESLAINVLFAPRDPLIPEILPFDDPENLPGKHLTMAQFQFFLDAIDLGTFAAVDGDLTTGMWFSFPVGQALLAYGEGSFTTKQWMPLPGVLSPTPIYTRKNGLRAMVGVVLSPPELDLSFYGELAYMGDAYDDNDWQTIHNSLAQADGLPSSMTALRTGIYGQFASAFRHGYGAPLYAGLHIKPNSALGGILDWSATLRYNFPAGLYTRLVANLSLPKGVRITMGWDAPFILNPSLATEELAVLTYSHRFTLTVGGLIQSGGTIDP